MDKNFSFYNNMLMPQWVRDYRDFEKKPFEKSFVALGNFDGLHRGHQNLLRSCRDDARRQQCPSILFTFWPHPNHVLRAEDGNPKLIFSHDERVEMFNRLGFDYVLEQEFDLGFSRITAEDFISKILAGSLRATSLYFGKNFHFGNRARGNLTLLQTHFSGALHATDLFQEGSEAISSSRIRLLLQKAQTLEAEKLLGYPYFVTGEVERGDGRGHQLGFPTANLIFSKECLLPYGVYAGRVSLFESPDVLHPAAINWGIRPSISGSHHPQLEAYLLDVSSDLYGKKIRVFFDQKLREEQKFSAISELKAQILRDVEGLKQLRLDQKELPDLQ